MHEGHAPHAEPFSAVSHERCKVYWVDNTLSSLKLTAKLKKLPDPRGAAAGADQGDAFGDPG